MNFGTNENTLVWLLFGLFGLVFLFIAVVRPFLDLRARQKAEKAVVSAQKAAFGFAKEDGAESDENLKIGKLFNLYHSQIDKYQQETQSRATTSFTYAVFAMLAGLAVLVWGGFILVYGGVSDHLISGSVVSAIGAATSAYITKTFLDVHKLSLIQLNHYFKQPVLNSHILTAQRLSDVLNGRSKTKAFEDIIDKVVKLILAEQSQSAALIGSISQQFNKPPPRRRRKPGTGPSGGQT
jgi:ABC-type multidrug transport system fused ATPase/permease subunit